ncbi:unnamed protein product, partial [Ilex paraguariensis]
MASALDTFCGQSYGAKQYHMLGIHMQRAMVVKLWVCIPLACVWANAGHILAFLGQDPEISAEAGHYARFMIPSIFAHALLQCCADDVKCRITTLLHFFICWFLVFKSGLGNKGAALANAISYWINVLLLAIYVRISPSCKNTWTGFSREALYGIPSYLKLAIPSAVMLCSFHKIGMGCALDTFCGTARGCGWQKIGSIVTFGAYYLLGIPCGILLAFVYHIGGK